MAIVEKNYRTIIVDSHNNFVDQSVVDLYAEAVMMVRGGMTLYELRDLLGPRFLLRLETFDQEVGEMVRMGFLRKRIPHTQGLEDWSNIGLVYVGNIPKTVQLERKWWQFNQKPEIEKRPDLAILTLAREGKFKSVILD